MKTLMALVLSLGMVLLGTAPVMAAGQAMQATAPLQQGKVMQVVVPDADVLRDVDLAQDKGSGPELYYVLRSAALGAATSAGGYIVAQKLKGKSVDPKIVAAKAAYGAATGMVSGTLGLAKKTIEYGGKVAKYTYNALKWTFKAAFSLGGYLMNRGFSR